MPKFLLGVAATFALALTLPLGSQAEAHKYRNKLCTAKPHFHSPISWKCKAAQKCCYDWVLRRGKCIAGADRCI